MSTHSKHQVKDQGHPVILLKRLYTCDLFKIFILENEIYNLRLKFKKCK